MKSGYEKLRFSYQGFYLRQYMPLCGNMVLRTHTFRETAVG